MTPFQPSQFTEGLPEGKGPGDRLWPWRRPGASTALPSSLQLRTASPTAQGFRPFPGTPSRILGQRGCFRPFSSNKPPDRHDRYQRPQLCLGNWKAQPSRRRKRRQPAGCHRERQWNLPALGFSAAANTPTVTGSRSRMQGGGRGPRTPLLPSCLPMPGRAGQRPLRGRSLLCRQRVVVSRPFLFIPCPSCASSRADCCSLFLFSPIHHH